MWKAIFIESCLLSALIFGGFYIHSKIIKEEIDMSEDSIQKLSNLAHISGNNSFLEGPKLDHLSGNGSKPPPKHISGKLQLDQANKP